MITKVINRLKWILGLFVLWLVYLFMSIFNYPVGKLSNSADVAVVLGAAVYRSKPSPVFAERLNHAINLYHNGQVKKLIFTGGIGEKIIDVNRVNKDKFAESEVARDYAISKNVTSEDIYIETSSLTTRENLIYAKQILDRKKLTTALIVSDPLHLKRAMIMAKDLDIQAQPSATPSSRYQSLKTKLPFAFRELYFYHHYLLFSD